MTKRYEVHMWLDTITLEPAYGATYGRSHICLDGKLCLFPEREEAEMFVDFLRLSHDDWQQSQQGGE